MAIVKWEPFGELASLRRQMDYLMESFFGREPMIYERERWIPECEEKWTEPGLL